MGRTSERGRGAGRTAWRARLLGLLLGIAISLLIGELGLRIASVEYPIFYVADPLLGAWHIPGASGRYRLEGDAFVSINADGMRDRDYPFEKPADGYRIAVIGDSYAEALQVDASEAFWSVLAEQLAACSALAGRQVEVLNFGVSGFGTGQELLALRHRAARYGPDLVLLPFVLNDVRGNEPTLEQDPSRPYFHVEAGELVLDEGFLATQLHREERRPFTRFKRWLRMHSRIVQLLYEVRTIPMRLARRETQGGALDDPVFSPPVAPEWTRAWAMTEILLLEIVKEAHAQGADFLLAVVSDGRQVHPDPAVRAARRHELGVPDLFYYEDRVMAFAAKEGIPAIGLSRPFRAHAEATGRCLHGFENAYPCDGHWNPLGHRLAGELFADEICGMLSGSRELESGRDRAR